MVIKLLLDKGSQGGRALHFCEKYFLLAQLSSDFYYLDLKE